MNRAPGPTPETDSFWRSTRGKNIRRTDYTKGFHTYGIEWSKDYLFTYIDSPLQQVMYWKFEKDRTMWQQGHFEGLTVNSSLVVDPWSQTGNPSTPFDQPFYLILNVAVGSRNGWFPDGLGKKPWTDAGLAAADFYKSKPSLVYSCDGSMVLTKFASDRSREVLSHLARRQQSRSDRKVGSNVARRCMQLKRPDIQC